MTGQNPMEPQNQAADIIDPEASGEAMEAAGTDPSADQIGTFESDTDDLGPGAADPRRIRYNPS